MSSPLSESTIVCAVAQEAARRTTRQIITELQRMKNTLSGDDSELKTIWDEICVQVQDEESGSWDAYDETVRSIVSAYIDKLPKHEREAIWLQTDAGSDWRYKEPEEREASPVCDDDIVEYLTRDYVYVEAGSWSNARVRAYIERSSERD